MFSAQLVVSYLLKEFGPCDDLRAPSRQEQKIISSFCSILREATYATVDIESDEDEAVEEHQADPSWTGEGEEVSAPQTSGAVRFGDVSVSEEAVNKAIAFYRSADKGRRSYSCMRRNFRFIRSPYHILKLRELERENEIRADRVIKLHTLKEKLKDIIMAKFNEGVCLHDRDLRQLALKLNRDDVHIANFKAGHHWIQDFKRYCGIVSRRVTIFTSKKNFLDADRLNEAAQAFVNEVKKEMEHWRADCICNADQSGFVKELHSSRTLAVRGSKKVVRVVQSLQATTHSFTVMPIIYMDGHLGEKLFVVLQERQGSFPTRGFFHANNIEVRAHTTHMMNKELLLEWIRSCVVCPNSPSSTLLIVDSWTSFKDHDAMQSAVPDEKVVKIMNIPAGTTSRIQPLDVQFFLTFKAMYKRFTSYVLAHDICFTLHHRDSILKILSLIYRQFCSQRFKNFISYAWFASGYTEAHPGHFENPLQYCFSPSILGNCEYGGCTQLFFIKCAHCEKLLCFEHFVVSYHMCA